MNGTANCVYCAQPYEVKMVVVGGGKFRWIAAPSEYRPRRATCSPACAKRTSAWNRYVNQRIVGDVNRPARVANLSAAGVAEAIAPFAVNPDQLQLAA